MAFDAGRSIFEVADQIARMRERGKVRLSMRAVDQETGEDLEAKEAKEKAEKQAEAGE